MTHIVLRAVTMEQNRKTGNNREIFGIKSKRHWQIINGMGCDTRYRVWQLVTNNHRTIIDRCQVTMKLFFFPKSIIRQIVD